MIETAKRISKDVVPWISAALLAVLFVVDVALPLGVAGGIPYIAVVLYSAVSRFVRLPLVIAGAGSVLTVLGGLLSPPGALLWFGVANRALAIAALWVVAVLAYRRRRLELERLEERVRNEEKLMRLNIELDSFSHTLSHDLRNHVSPIIGYSTLLREDYADCLNDEGRRMASEIESRGRRMLELMEDLLELARVGRIEPPSSPIDANAVLSRVLDDIDEQVGESGLKIVVMPLEGARVPASLLSQVFGNLVINALKYAGPSGGPIEIGAVAGPGNVRYFVRDHGPGIPEKERELVFESFKRGSAEQGHGSGIGLAIVRKVASLYGGRAWVEETPGGGATFWVEISASAGGEG